MTAPVSPTCPLPAEVTERTVFALLHRNAALYPNKLALIADSITGVQARLSYAALSWQIDKAADGLRRAGVRQGDHVAILLNNTAAAEYVLAAFGAMRLGAVVVPLNGRFAVPELVAAVEDMDCSVLIHGAEFADRVLQVLGKTSDALRLVIQAGDGGVDGHRRWEGVLAQGIPATGGFPDPGEDDLADILLTSGTTGRSKGVLLTHGNAVATGIAIASSLDLGPQDTYQSPFPLFTSSGFHFNLMAAWWAGATMVIEPGVDIEETLRRMTRERSTVYCAVPAVYIFLLDSYTEGEHDLSAMRIFDYGGAPMAREVIRRLAEVFPHVELRQTYGLTESGPSGTFLPGADSLRKLGSIGKAMALCEVSVVRPDASPVEPGEMGEIVMRGPAVCQGYYKRPDATAELLHDGWLWTGDLGTIDEDGYLFYLDRNKDVIIRGGFNVASMEVENAIFEHPGVMEVSVVAKPHDKLGEDICAFVVPQRGTEIGADDLIAFCKLRIADYKVPRHWEFVEELPRNPTGKIQKNVLRDMARHASSPGTSVKKA